MMNKSIQRFETPFAVAQAVAELVEHDARYCIAQRGVFHWVLAGGTTPKQCYELLRDADIEWSKVHVWFGDERCLPVGDDERNDVMADEALLKHVPIPQNQIHRIDAELGQQFYMLNHWLILSVWIWYCWVWGKMDIRQVCFPITQH